MDNQQPNEVTLIKDELQSPDPEPTDKAEVIQNLQGERLRALQLANVSERKCMELQAMLEEERRVCHEQTEDSIKQVQCLQAQLHGLQADMEVLREQKEEALLNTREELRVAREEQSREVGSLQADLSTVSVELQRWRQAARQYEVEINVLQSNLQQQSQHRNRAVHLQGELEKLQSNCSSLETNCRDFSSEKEALLAKLQKSGKELERAQVQCATLNDTVGTLEQSKGELESALGSLVEQNQQNEAKLRAQLTQANGRSKDLQKEYEDTQAQLSDLRDQMEQMELEKQSITDELQNCKVTLKLLQDKGSNTPLFRPVQAIFTGLILAVLYWYFGPMW